MQLKQQLARGSSLVSVITLLGHLLSIGMKLIVSRSYGVAGFGEFALIMALSRFSSTIVQMGLNHSIIRFISKFTANQDWTNARSFFRAGIMHILKVSGLFLILIVVLRNPLLRILNLEEIGGLALLIVWGISIVIAVNNYLSATLRGTKHFMEQAILFTSSFPILMIVAYFGLWIFLSQAPDLLQFFIWGIVLNAIMLVIVYFLVRGIFKKTEQVEEVREDTKQLSRYSLPIWFSSALQSALASSDRIMLGMLSTLTEVGIYGAGLTFSVLFAFPLKSMGPVFQPFIIEAYERKNLQQINELYNTMVRWSSLFVIPVLGMLISFGDRLLLLFGRDFQEAYWVMLILATAQSISTISGIAGTMLNITDKQRTHARIMTFGFLLAIALNLLLIPPLGALGAALGTGVSILVINLIRVYKLISYYSLKTDYSVIVSVTLKFIPLVILTRWVESIEWAHWLVLLMLFLTAGTLLVYMSLTENERQKLMSRLKGVA